MPVVDEPLGLVAVSDVLHERKEVSPNGVPDGQLTERLAVAIVVENPIHRSGLVLGFIPKYFDDGPEIRTVYLGRVG